MPPWPTGGAQAINRNPSLYPEPDLFKPDRFIGTPLPRTSLPVGAPGGAAFGFLPFGAGSRTCVGQRFAVLEGVQLLAGIIKAFRIRPPPDLTVREHVSITLRPRGLRLFFAARL